MKTFSEYEAAALSTAVYPGQGGPLGLMYVALKGAGEAGEFAGHLVDEPFVPVKALTKEVGDELWYLAAKARELGTTLAEVAGRDDLEGFTFGLEGHVGSTYTHALVGAKVACRFAELVGKAVRDDGLGAIQINVEAGTLTEQGLSDARREELKALLFDQLANLVVKAALLGTDLSTIAAGNAEKLLDRKARGVLQGDGDNR
ncbi:hypothetical protein [Sphingomonas jaspsi]|uniref:hypothetical protein n=1 Tax=Sphingomonas jaspsi TaxID=392409 RepID=UPI0004B4D7C4|nr:hypothetical protein [Sphingomonas jaspsi]